MNFCFIHILSVLLTINRISLSTSSYLLDPNRLFLDLIPSGLSFNSLIKLIRDAGETSFGPPPYWIRTEEIPYQEYDYIVVGGGTSGSVLAKRLSEDPSISVLVIEAGSEESGFSAAPAAWIFNIGSNRDYQYLTVPQDHAGFGMNNNEMTYATGKVIGGGSSINRELYTRGVPEDYERWVELGAKNWSYADVFPYFIKSERLTNDPYADPGYHGTKGPMDVTRTIPNFPFEVLILRDEQELDQVFGDYNGARRVGIVNKFQVCTKNGSRVSTARAYLENNPENLHILLNSFATRILIDSASSKKKAYAVEFTRLGSRNVVRARKEIIVCTGVHNTPKLLMLSGIGPIEELRRHGIPVMVNLPGVGRNLQDHVYTSLNFRMSREYGYLDDPEIITGKFITEYIANKTGFLSTVGSTAVTYFRTRYAQDERPDFQLEQHLFTNPPSLFNIRDEIFNNLVLPHIGTDLLFVILSLIRPLSRGLVKLHSSDPLAPPLIDPRYLSNPNDAQALAEFCLITLQLMEVPSLRATLKPELLDNLIGCEHLPRQSFEFFECYARHMTFSQLHGCCTAKMGHDGDKMAVVDEQLRVRGVKNLRIGDTSVWPEIVSGNPMATVIATAERLADLIMGHVLKPFTPPYKNEDDVLQYTKIYRIH